MIIGITGYAGVGKDTVADLLTYRANFEKRAFADKVREAYYEVAPDAHRHAIDLYGWDDAKRSNLHIRTGLQGLGAMCRKVFGLDFWIEQALKGVLFEKVDYVFADVRYPNEAEAIKARGGVIVRLKRDNVFPVNNHESETNVDSIEADLVLENTSPESAVSEILELIKWRSNG